MVQAVTCEKMSALGDTTTTTHGPVETVVCARNRNVTQGEVMDQSAVTSYVDPRLSIALFEE